VKFGILVTAVHDGSVPPSRQLGEDQALVQLADDLGFTTMYVGQHFLADEIRFLQPVPYLAYLSHWSARMRLATGIALLSLLHPVDAAEQMATLDAISGGRAVFGVGLGYSETEFAAFGIPKASRVRRFEESIAVLRQLWSGEPVDFTGEHFALKCAPSAVQPVQPGGIPIWIGGQSEPAVRRAARLGDAWYAAPFPTMHGLRDLRDTWVAERQRLGLGVDGEFPVRRDLVIAPTREQALERAYALTRKRYAAYARWGLDDSPAAAPTGWASLAEEEIGRRFILGPPESCAEQLLELERDTGMTEFVYKPHWAGVPHEDGMRQLERFGSEVLPLLPAATPSTTPVMQHRERQK